MLYDAAHSDKNRRRYERPTQKIEHKKLVRLYKVNEYCVLLVGYIKNNEVGMTCRMHADIKKKMQKLLLI